MFTKKKLFIQFLSVFLIVIILIVALPLITSSVAFTQLDRFSYTVSDNKIMITDYTGMERDVSLAASYIVDGTVMPVTAVGDYAFENSTIISVNLPDGLEAIGEGSFYNCDGLTNISIPESVIIIGDYAFDDCNNLISIAVNGKNTVIGESSFGYYGVTTGSGRNQVTNYYHVDGLTIFGYESSLIQEYATTNNLNFSILSDDYELGDVNCDKIVDIRDLICIKKIIAGLAQPTVTARIIGNGNTAASDIVVLKQLLLSPGGSTRYMVFFVDGDGNVINTNRNVEAGGTIIPPVIPDKDGYRFEGWSKPTSGIKENSVIRALFIKTYNVIFYDYDGKTVLKKQTVDVGADAVAPDEPVRSGYLFTGWNGNYTSIQADTNVTATYTNNQKTPALRVSNATTTAGATKVTVAVFLENNPGFLTMALNMAFNNDVFTLTKVSTGVNFTDYNFTAPKNKKSGCTAAWFSSDLPEEIIDGDIMTLEFTIAANAPKGNYPITVSCPNDGSTVDGNKQVFIMSNTIGYITVD